MMSRIEYSWQGCSSAEPASASSMRSAYQKHTVRFVSDPPAVPCVSQDCARELGLPIHSIVCFRAGRFVITQSSRTGFEPHCSRKWMSGHAVHALVLQRDRGQFATHSITSLGEPLPPSQGKPPFPLDRHLSWMSWIPLSKSRAREWRRCGLHPERHSRLRESDSPDL